MGDFFVLRKKILFGACRELSSHQGFFLCKDTQIDWRWATGHNDPCLRYQDLVKYRGLFKNILISEACKCLPHVNFFQISQSEIYRTYLHT